MVSKVVKTLLSVSRLSDRPVALMSSNLKPKNLCSILGLSRNLSATVLGSIFPAKSGDSALASSSNHFTRCKGSGEENQLYDISTWMRGESTVNMT